MRAVAWTCSLVVVVALAAAGCARKSGAPVQAAAPESAPVVSHPEGATAAAGVRWAVPSGWRVEASRPMRVATYSVPPAPGDGEAGECAVYYFGNDQGGSVAANVARWSSQFEGDPTPKTSVTQVNGVTVTEVEVSGTYLPPGGPMMQLTGKEPNYKLLGAIVAAPEGSVFFKFTGPTATVTAASHDFDALIASLKKE